MTLILLVMTMMMILTAALVTAVTVSKVNNNMKGDKRRKGHVKWKNVTD